MRISYKESVRIQRRPSWVLDRIERAAWDSAPQLYGGVLVVTSANDSEHMEGSAHYIDRALDLRFTGRRPGGIVVKVKHDNWVTFVQDQQDEAMAWEKRLQEKLGDDFDAVYEGDHMHVEYDPR